MSVFKAGDTYTWLRGAKEHRIQVIRVNPDGSYLASVEGLPFQTLTDDDLLGKPLVSRVSTDAQYALTQAAKRVQAIEDRMSQAAKEGRKGDVENDRPVLAQAYQDFYAKWKACQ